MSEIAATRRGSGAASSFSLAAPPTIVLPSRTPADSRPGGPRTASPTAARLRGTRAGRDRRCCGGMAVLVGPENAVHHHAGRRQHGSHMPVDQFQSTARSTAQAITPSPRQRAAAPPLTVVSGIGLYLQRPLHHAQDYRHGRGQPEHVEDRELEPPRDGRAGVQRAVGTLRCPAVGPAPEPPTTGAATAARILAANSTRSVTA